jgi:hypothetical protein
VGIGALERGNRAIGSSRDYATRVALLALVLGQQEQAVFQRLREWYLDAKHKSGKKRRELDVTTCFAPLLRWIVRLWGSGNQQMVLVLDATTLGERWTILSISVVIGVITFFRTIFPAKPLETQKGVQPFPLSVAEKQGYARFILAFLH